MTDTRSKPEDWPIVIVESPFAPSKEEIESAAWQACLPDSYSAASRALFTDQWRRYKIYENRTYAVDCCQDCLRRQEVPYASHLFFPQMLNDTNSIEREIGLTAGYAMWRGASRIVFYLDKGWSPGMLRAKARAERLQLPTEERYLQLTHQENTDGRHASDTLRPLRGSDATPGAANCSETTDCQTTYQGAEFGKKENDA